MHKRSTTHTPRRWLIVPALCTGLALAADAPKPQADEDLELEEVLVEGRKPETDRRKLTAWIDRLVGQFSYQGYVERRSADGTVTARAEVDGATRCDRFGKAVAVQCLVHASWPQLRGPDGAAMPGGVSALTPAVAVYALGRAKSFIGHLQVDSNGIAAGEKGWILDDTLIARAPCVDFPGKCERIVRLEAPPDGKVLRMRVDIEQDGRLALRYSFQWNRLASGETAKIPDITAATSQPAAARTGAVAVPRDIDRWLRRLAGQFHVVAGSTCSSLEERPLVGDKDRLEAAIEVTGNVDCSGEEPEEPRMTRNRPAEAQCQSIGAGPGVRCRIYMAWPETGVHASKRASMKLNPGYMLYGFDPVQKGVAIMEATPLSSVGPAGFMSGRLKDDKLEYQEDCARPCNATTRMQSPVDGNRITWRLTTRTNESSKEGRAIVQQFGWALKRVPPESLDSTKAPRKAPENPPARPR